MIPNSGIQYVALEPLETTQVPTLKLVLHGPASETGRLRIPALPASESNGSRGDEYWDPDPDDALADEVEVVAKADVLWEIVDALERVWLPFPMDVGGAWVAIQLRRGEEAGRIDIWAAVDTTLDDAGNPEHGLSEEELGAREPLATSRRFWRQQMVADWIDALVSEIQDVRGDRGVDRTRLQLAIAALADHLSNRRSRLILDFAAKPQPGSGVDVDLVLDLGNSRTCALLMEHFEGRREGGLELVYPDDPGNPIECPFETQFAFADQQVVPEGIEEDASFRFLSPCKLGPAAAVLLRRTPVDARSVGLSSPKRYLWDALDPVPWRWCRADVVGTDGQPRDLSAPILKHIDPNRPLKKPLIPELPAECRHPRLAAAIWTLVEILEQAFRQINSTKWRQADQGKAGWDRRREISNLVIMHPAGMHSQEILAYQKACQRACELWVAFRSDPVGFASGESASDEEGTQGLRPPKIQIAADEGTAIQMCWLYGELLHRHGRNLSEFFSGMGRERVDLDSRSDDGEDVTSSPVLRVASLDIGGGTIDLSIADYQQDTDQPTETSIVSQRLFHDGMSCAGDDIILGFTRAITVPAMVECLGLGDKVWSDFLATTDVGEHDASLRSKLVRSVWQPIAHACIGAFEDDADFNSTITCRLDDVPGLDLTQLAELEARIVGRANHDNMLAGASFSVKADDLRQVVRQSVGRTLTQCSLVIHEYDCDLLVVGGRPSSNPAIREYIRDSMPVPPGQLIFLADMGRESWYPLGDGRQILDAKTCGVVGGGITFRARRGYEDFLLRSIEPCEPAPEFGRAFRVSRYRFAIDDKNTYPDLGDGQTITYQPKIGEQADSIIASRRFSDPEAEAKPLYRLEVLPRLRSDLRKHARRQDPCEVTLRLEGLGMEIPGVEPGAIQDDVVRVDQIEGVLDLGQGRTVPASKGVRLVLRTLLDTDHYWIDSGVIPVGE
ncbi:MAG: hypothetical protein CMJ34_01885 [Phycisphaerae bacterium]|nr:hypothetical protein [Phycisphaerae bacterium]